MSVDTLTDARGEPASSADTELAAPWVRWFVRVFLSVFVVCGLVGIEAWPLTGWRLFSHLRHQERTGWQAMVVDPEGNETAFSFRGRDPGDRAFVLVMKAFPSMSVAGQQAVCRTWLGLARNGAPTASSLRIYLATWRMVPRRQRRPADPGSRSLRYTCTDASVEGPST